jgi:hypothetical protein
MSIIAIFHLDAVIFAFKGRAQHPQGSPPSERISSPPIQFPQERHFA